jgi:polar amino acid transport system substrate-binding protein
MWLVSENEADLTALWEPLNEENLAWGVRKNDRELLMNINSMLTKWKKDGTLKRILLKWLPPQYLERFKE